MIIVPDIADLPANEEYVTLFSEIDLTIFKKSGEEYVVETTLVFDSFCAEELTIIGEGEGTNELCEYISVSGKKSIISTKGQIPSETEGRSIKDIR